MNSYNVYIDFDKDLVGVRGVCLTIQAESNEQAILVAGYAINPDFVKHVTDINVSDPTPVDR